MELSYIVLMVVSCIIIISVFIFINDIITEKIESKTVIEMAKLGYEQHESIGSCLLKWVKKEGK